MYDILIAIYTYIEISYRSTKKAIVLSLRRCDTILFSRSARRPSTPPLLLPSRIYDKFFGISTCGVKS